MFNKSPDNLWNALFNVPQGATMTVAVSLYLGQADLVNLFKTFVCAYCAGVMLTLFCASPLLGRGSPGIFIRTRTLWPIIWYAAWWAGR